MTTENEQGLRENLRFLKEQHRQLDNEIRALHDREIVDQLEVSRLKKRKLSLKDQIIRIECNILPDIIA